MRVTRGAVWDVAVDLRHDSPSFGKWYDLELSERNHLMFWIPAGFAHGFVALEDDSELQYKCTAHYPTKARRPAYSVLSKERIMADYHLAIPAWQESLEHFIQLIAQQTFHT